MKGTTVQGEQGTLLFWDPVIQRALTDQSALQWICSARLMFGRIYDLSLIAKVGEGWYLSDQPTASRVFAHPVSIRFALQPEIFYDNDVEVLTPLQRRVSRREDNASFTRKFYFTQRIEIPFRKDALSGCILYDVLAGEVLQPAARTHFSILLKE